MVLEEFSGSDHQLIQFDLINERPAPDIVRAVRGWNERKLSSDKLDERIKTYLVDRSPWPEDHGLGVDGLQERFGATLGANCDGCMPKKVKGVPGRKPVHWWSSEIAELRRRCLAAKRVHQRQRRVTGGEGDELAGENYRQARRDLRTAINAAKARSWNQLCVSVDEDPWGLPYRIDCNEAVGLSGAVASFKGPGFPPDGGGNTVSQFTARGGRTTRLRCGGDVYALLRGGVAPCCEATGDW